MGQKTKLTRRSFIGGAAALAAGAAAGLAGCAANGQQAVEEKTGATESWDEEFDVVVCGAGIAGLAAAVTVATEGDGASCLLMEKEPSPNGNSPFCAGSMLYCEDADAFMTYLDAMIGDSTPDDVKRAFAEELAHNLTWLYDLGAKEEWLEVGPPDDVKLGEWPELPNDNTYGRIKFKTDGDGPKHVFQFFLDTMQSHADAVTYRTSTAMESLVQDPQTKTILGVVDTDGKRYKANKGVIVCTGGFESDAEMLYNYTGVKGVFPYAGKANTGDGHRACMKVGADFWHMAGGAQYWMALRNLENTEFVSTVWNFTTKQHGITVGVNGRRFYQDYDACSCPTTPYAEADSDPKLNVGYRHGITQFGGNWTHLPFPEKAWFVFDAEGLAAGAFPEDKSADPVADGWAVSAASIEELAEAIEVPSDELAKTVGQWNDYCERGEDLAFYRPADTLQPVKTPPFYAMVCVPAMLNTDGGPVRGPHAEVLDPFGEPIPHLYTAGEFGSVWGHLYQGTGNVGECAAFGRISARSALSN